MKHITFAATLVAAWLNWGSAGAQCDKSNKVSAAVFLEARFDRSNAQYGMGVFISAQGDLLTALHVVQNRRKEFTSNVSILPASVVSDVDVQKRIKGAPVIRTIYIDADRDIALLRVEAPSGLQNVTTPCVPVAKSNGQGKHKGFAVLPPGGLIRFARDVNMEWHASNEKFFLGCPDQIGASTECNVVLYTSARPFPVILVDSRAKKGFSGGPVYNNDDELIGIADLSTSGEQTIAVGVAGIGSLQQTPAETSQQLAMGPQHGPEARLATVVATGQSPHVQRAVATNSTCTDLAEYADTLAELETASEYWASTGKGKSSDRFVDPQSIASFEVKLVSLAKDLERNNKCGQQRRYIPEVTNALIGSLKAMRDQASVRTLWNSVLNSFIRPGPSNTLDTSDVRDAKKLCSGAPGAWVTVSSEQGTITLNPVERMFLCALPGGPEAAMKQKISTTDPCQIFDILIKAKIGTRFTTCDKAYRDAWQKLVNAFPRNVTTWSGLVTDPAEQIKLWSRAIVLGFISALPVLEFASAMSTEQIVKRTAYAGSFPFSVESISETLEKLRLVRDIDAEPHLERARSLSLASQISLERISPRIVAPLSGAVNRGNAQDNVQKVLVNFLGTNELVEAFDAPDSEPIDRMFGASLTSLQGVQRELVDLIFEMAR